MKAAVADRETKIYAVRIVASNGTTVRFVQYPHDLTMGGNTYRSDQGYQFTDYSATSSLAPSVIDIEGILTAAGIGRDEIESGIWNSAKGYVFATSWTNPTEDEEPIGKFILGEITQYDDRYVCQMMQLVDALSQSVGRSHGPLCPWTLFDETLDGRVMDSRLSKCGLSIDDYKETGTVTAVTSGNVIQDTARAEAAEYFTAGAIHFTTGLNAGLAPQEIKQYAADGTITLFFPFHYAVAVGDEYEMIPGCRKRRDEDCVAKFSNAENFGGFPDMPPSSVYQQVGQRR